MECNRDEAVKAKKIAENKIIERDIASAKKFALKAQSLFPELDGLSQLLQVIELYAASEERINGEFDHYRILGVDPSTEVDELKEQYIKMAMAIHRDKNKSIGAKGAYKILSQVWNVLSNKEKRLAYDLRMNFRTPNLRMNVLQDTSVSPLSKTSMYTTSSLNPMHIATRPGTHVTILNPQVSVPPYQQTNQTPYTSSQYYATLFHARNFFSGTDFHSSSHQNAPPGVTSSQYNPALFQTENPNGRSHNWQVPYHQNTPELPFLRNPRPFSHFQFAAASNPQFTYDHHRAPQTSTPPYYVPIVRPTTFHKSTLAENPMAVSCPRTLEWETFWTACSRCGTYYEYHKSFLNQNLRCQQCFKPFLAVAMPRWTNTSRGVASSVTVDTLSGSQLQSSLSNLRRRNVEELNSSKGIEALHNVKNGRQSGGCSKPVHKRTSTNLKRTSVAEQTVHSGCGKPKSQRELLLSDVRDMLVVRARMEIRSKLNDGKVSKIKPVSEKKPKMKYSMNPLTDNLIGDQRAVITTDSLFISPNYESQPQRSSKLCEPNDVCADFVQSMSMSVPDADFHDFDESRTEKSFSGNQIWAAYDDDDGMPRYYALVHNVISRNPFKMQIRWLNSKTTKEFGSLDWIGSGFTKVSGNFRAGKYVISTNLNSFSHPVEWRKGTRGAIQIFPAKGDVWALYTNWSLEWNELTPVETIHKYDMVVVLEDYSDHKGVVVAPLVKVARFRAVFRQHLDIREIITIPKEEIFRFSHQVPSHILNGHEAVRAPRGCFELDPAALTRELLNMLPDVSKTVPESVVKHEVQLKGLTLDGGGVQETKPMLTYSRRNKRKKIAGDAEESQV